jgi:hypothetical protein
MTCFQQPKPLPILLTTSPSPNEELDSSSDRPNKRQKIQDESSKTCSELPKLVSIVEIIKREYSRLIDSATQKVTHNSEQGESSKEGFPSYFKNLPRNLHQYNELTCLERQSLEENGGDPISDREKLDQFLAGKR